ncbi:hypothetical protein [Haloplanus rubicundus]|uniref:Uncharacterized protein n=1 Tax=Haloplanus rubicundus TaxID=1547898 RepID=A0A345EH12_9EURY|nr:hypothetical protein [Haloplanus rubicundus]AXG11484.1 hypothetical protein DU484_17370 [Haloplanus rubicundus]
MRNALTAVGDRLRRPEYTGENRCLPCTVVNVCLTLVLAAVATVALTPLGGVVVLVGGLGAVYFRGYLVPGTPTLTVRYFPPWLLELFGKDVELRETLQPIEGVAVRATPEGGRLVDSFAAAWDDRIESMRATGASEADVATLLGVDEVSNVGEAAYVVDSGLRQWLSPSALLADAAAAAVLADRGDDAWTSLDPDERVATLRDLRKHLDYCPLCGGALDAEETETVETCCTESERVLMATCLDCDVRLIEDLNDR